LVIRVASYLDIPAHLMLLSEMHAEAPDGYGALNWAKVVRKITDAIDQGIVFVYEEDGQIFGSIGGEIGTDWWSDDHAFGDLWFYVRKDKRASKAGFALLKAIKQWGKDNEVSLRVAHVFGGDVDRTDALYARAGFKRLGSVYSEGI
jgi:GNAT superfamily N-acetyltransferase